MRADVTPYVSDPDFTLWNGDAREVLSSLEAQSVDCAVTSPPYLGLRDYGHDDQIGLESSIGEYVQALVSVFQGVRRVLADTGTLWLNLGDSYNAYNGGAGPSSALSQTQSAARPRLATGFGLQQKELKPKDLMGIPWRVAFALQADGWYLRSDIIWSKPNPMPESVTDRPTKSHEYVFLLSKSARYFFDADSVREPYKYDGRNVTHVEARDGSAQHRSGERWPGLKPRKSGNLERKPNPAAVLGNGDTSHGIPWTEGVGRNIRSVWEIATQPYSGAHFATFPEALVERCIKAGCPESVCGTCGKPRGAEVVRSPLGSGPVDDPTRLTGRKGMNRERREGEGTRPITKSAQRDYARQLRDSSHRPAMEAEAGDAFAHYIRTDDSGARPVPALLLDAWIERGWLTAAEASGCGHNNWVPGTVLDPFMGSGTTALVARRLGRKSVGVELNADYCAMAARRLGQQSLLAEPAA